MGKHFKLQNGTQFVDIHSQPPDRIRLGYNQTVSPNSKKRIETIVRYWAQSKPISNDGLECVMWWDKYGCELTFSADFASGYFKGNLTHRHAISSPIFAKTKDENFNIGLAYILNNGVIPKTDRGLHLPAPRKCNVSFIQFEYGVFDNNPPDTRIELAMQKAVKEIQDIVSPAGMQAVQDELKELRRLVAALQQTDVQTKSQLAGIPRSFVPLEMVSKLRGEADHHQS